MASRDILRKHHPRLNGRIIRFDRYQVDPASGELRKDGRKIRLQPQPFQLLVLLLRNAGGIVSREEVRLELWPEDTFVDFDHGLAAAVNKMRAALGDSAEKPKFVETLPRRGYRFIGTISSPDNTADLSNVTPMPVAVRGVWLSHRLVMISMLCACLILAVVGVDRWRTKHDDLPFSAPRPFTTLPGIETAPAFSPDGSRVAFAWNGGADGQGFDLYVKTVGSETQLQLTHHPSEFVNPAWSPDGTYIAFHRVAGGDTGVYVIPALGGPERKLASTNIPYNIATTISWSPNGRWIAYGAHMTNPAADHIFLVSVDTLEVRALPHEPKCWAEANPLFSHDGRTLFFSCVHSANSIEIHSVPSAGGAPTAVVPAQNVMVGYALSADDSRIVFSHFGAGGQTLSVASVKDHSVHAIEGAEGVWPSISARDNQLAYSADTGRTSIWRRDILHPELQPTRILSSSRSENTAQYSPDGKHIAFESDRGGPWAVWMSDVDGGNLVRVSKEIRGAETPRWSPDGRRIAFDTAAESPSSIYVVDVADQVPRRLNSNVDDIKMPSWSHDGKLIYFTAEVNKGHKIYRIPAEGGNAEEVRSDPWALRPIESPDGAYLYLASREVTPELNKVQLLNSQPGAAPEPILRVRDCFVWDVMPAGIYFVPAASPKVARYFDFASHRTTDLFSTERGFGSGFSLSPDGRYLLYAEAGAEDSDIMVIDRYR
ncbi:MAG: PD40 domain-containing protein [Acidobacteriaceae bacterium]|nr:PD40 domain-containing protein [Acidobacteriaceae bacterium]